MRPIIRAAIILICALSLFSGCAKPQRPAVGMLASADGLMKQGKLIQAGVEVDRAINSDPTRTATYFAAMEMYKQNGCWNDYARVADQMIAAAVSSKLDRSLADDEVSRICKRAAGVCMVAGSTGRAYAILQKGVKLAPNDPGLLNDFAYYYADNDMNIPQSLAMAKRAIAAEPNNAYYIDTLGWAQYKSGDYSAAVASLKKAVSLSPDEPVSRYHLGAAYAKAGQTQQACLELRKVVKLSPEMAEATALLKRLTK